MGLREWATRLDEREIERGADTYRKGVVPPLAARLIAAAIAVTLGLILVYVARVPFFVAILPVVVVPVVLALVWQRTQK